MSNDLTGDFDVVAQFSIGAANRVIAAMHRAERFFHSTSLRVEDNSLPDHIDPSVIASVDFFGDASVDHESIPPRLPQASVAGAAPSVRPSLSDSVVNFDVVGVLDEPFVPSRLQGRAQLQLAPPTIAVTDSSGKKVTLTTGLRARYFPDPQTPPVAEFVRGQLQITASVNQVASQVANVVEIDIKGSDVTASFIHQWSSTPISAQDLAGLNRLLRNALRTSFLPSSATLPSNIAQVQFKTLRGARDALAILLNMSGAAGNPASQANVFLGAADDFALAAGVDFVQSEFEPTLANIRNQQIAPVSFTINGLVHTWHITYTFAINSVTLELKNGSMVLSIKGHAHTSSWPPDFDFTVNQVMTLKVVGSTAELELGDLSIDTSSWIIDRFRGAFTSRVEAIRDRALDQSNAQTTVRKALNADEKLGGLLDSLLRPQRPSPGPQPKAHQLSYSSAELRTSGIVLHGRLGVTDWPPAHVEFERIPTTTSTTGPLSGTHGIRHGPTYSALKSWIPGGTIQRYEWSTVGQPQPFLVDENTFLYTDLELGPGFELASESLSPAEPATPPIVSGEITTAQPFPGYVPLCLTVKGSRISPSGSPILLAVSNSVCGYSDFPIVASFDLETDGAAPMVALTQPGPNGFIEVGGHASARTSRGSGGAPNLIVHFAANGGGANLDNLTRALSESGRTDSPTAILAILDPGQLEKTRYTPGVVYAEKDGGWERVFGIKAGRKPTTLIVGPDREIRWRHEGEVDSRTLAEALRKSLVKSGPIRLGLVRSSVRIGQPPPNFIFEHAPGREITLRKLAGRPVTLVFWKSSSNPSIKAVQAHQHAGSPRAGDYSVVLAVNDGESDEAARKAAAQNKLSATVVTDPARTISSAYGVSVWPTVVTIDERGLVSGIRYGGISEDSLPSPVAGQSAETVS
jgi:peroxiredoxin